MEIIAEDDLCNNAAKMGEYLKEQLFSIAQRHPVISNVRGRGLLTAFDFPDKTTRDNFIKSGLLQNVMFLGCGERSIRFRPALIIEKKHIDEGLTILENISANM
jgi:L-lysine 6-transaminase